MMRRFTAAVAAGLFICLAGFSASAATVEEQSSYDSFPPQAVTDAVDKSGKQTVYIILDQNKCSTTCGQMLQQFIYAQGDYPNIAFKSGTPEEWGIPKELLPFILVVTPKCGVTRRMANYTPATPEAIAYLVSHLNDNAAMAPVTRTCQ